MKLLKVLLLILAFSFTTLNAVNNNALVTLNVENANVKDVLRALAQIAGANIVLSKDVSGTVTLSLYKVPWRTALGIVTEAAGLSYQEKDGIITITSKAEYETIKSLAKLQTIVVSLKYAKAKEVQGILEKKLSERGSLEIDQRTNSIIVTDLPDVIKDIKNLIKMVDVPNKQVMISARIVEVDYDAAKQLGINWSIGNVLDTLAKTRAGVSVIAGGEGESGLLIKFGKVLPTYDINAVLNQLESESKANILSEPKIMVEDNQKAMISSGKMIPVIMRDQAGNPVVTFYDATLKLSVTPHISPNNEITMELEPQVGDIAGILQGSSSPIISLQRAHTVLRVKDGQTVVIGGVLKTRSTVGHQGVPFISKLPVIGSLFGSRATSTEKKEILIFVTPRIVANE